MNMHIAERNALPDEPPIRRVFRDVIVDRLAGLQPPQAAMLFQSSVDPLWTDDRFFLGDFYNKILHQDTCQPGTADGVPLLAVLAVDDRVPPQQRFEAINLLFSTATAADRHLADCWPNSPRHADPESEDRAREAVRSCAPDLLARWAAECPAVRLALAGLAVAFPTARTLPALTPRLRGFVEQHPPGTDIGDYVRFILVLAAENNDQTFATVESLTNTYWESTSRGAPTPARALHLLGQMMNRVKTGLTRSRPRE
ncbi:hypothetical protein [Streptomyces hydrogenans]|uniref:hypothetical protein n=1 Tax=Streptomyces hydrogenans TaxID=1873719 RepID=UPI00278BD21C|nr:hypothetical protein [Streptomyces hydrogenans]